MESAHNTDQHGVLTHKMVLDRYSISAETLRNWTKFRSFPAPFKIGKLSYWRLEDIVSFEDDRRRA